MGEIRGVRGLWDFKSSGIIWRILPAGDRMIVGEERDAAAKSVSFFCVALDDGRVVWRGIRPAERWWSGIDAVHRGMLFLHEYPVPGMPDHRKIFAIDLETGAAVWENAELAFGFARDGALYASRDLFDRRQFFELDLRTGSLLREVPADSLAGLRSGSGPEWEMDVELPLAAGDAPDAIREAFPRGTALEPGETLRYGDTEIWNWYEVHPDGGAGRKLREHLFVIDAPTGAILFRDIVCDGLSLPAGTTFFRAGERILYVRERTTLRSFSLSTGDPS